MAQSKLDQIRALRERQFEPADSLGRHNAPPAAIVESAPQIAVSDPGLKAKPPFDRVAYQREYMRKRRAKPLGDPPMTLGSNLGYPQETIEARIPTTRTTGETLPPGAVVIARGVARRSRRKNIQGGRKGNL